MIYYQLYLVENLVNGKTYIGKHRTDTSKIDDYLGSGILIKNDIKKYGRHNFNKYVLERFETEEEVDFYEKRYINFYKLDGKCEYNINNGGGGSCCPNSEETRKKIRESLKETNCLNSVAQSKRKLHKIVKGKGVKLCFNNITEEIKNKLDSYKISVSYGYKKSYSMFVRQLNKGQIILENDKGRLYCTLINKISC
jgi:hypothetical protein